MQQCEKVLVCPWNHDPAVVGTHVLLSVLNDSLRQSPVLVQVYASNVRTIDIPYPAADDTALKALAVLPDAPAPSTAMSAGAAAAHMDDTLLVQPRTAASHDQQQQHEHKPHRPPHELSAEVGELARREDVELAAAALHLPDACGYLRLAKLSDRWVPLEAHFGIPLFDDALNAAVLQRIEARRLFTAGQLRQYTRAVRTLALDVLDFIALMGGGDAGGGAVPLPTRQLVFDGERLSVVV